MNIEIKINGKINPLYVNHEDVNITVLSNKIMIKKITFNFYKSKEEMIKGFPFFTLNSIERNIKIKKDILPFGEVLFLKVNIYDEKDKEFEKRISFLTGINGKDFTAKWIEYKNFNGKVSKFTKNFYLKEKPKKVLLYIVGLGYYESFVNHKKTDNFYFKPIFTDYDVRKGLNNKDYDEKLFCNDKKTICYDIFDVSKIIKKGDNVLNVLLGTGWYCNTDKTISDPSVTYGNPKLLFELHLLYEDREEKIISDESCLVEETAIISQLYLGDRIDFSKENGTVYNAVEVNKPQARLILNTYPLDVVKEKIKPKEISKLNNGVLYDFGKNHTGGLYLKIKGKRGSRLKISYFEIKEEGVLNNKTCEWLAYDMITKKQVGSIQQESEYILSGDVDLIRPYFHWNCYRYAKLKCDDKFCIFDVSSLFIYTDVKKDLFFFSSNNLFNKLFDAFILTQESNMHGCVPSDCPHREKVPYTGDGSLVAESVLFCFDSVAFYRKWINDINCAQANNGFVPFSAPYIAGWGGYWWSNAIVTVPYTLYKITGDKSILENSIEHILKYIEYCKTQINSNLILDKVLVSRLLSDWLTPEVTKINVGYMNTLAFYYTLSTTCEIFRILERKVDFDNLLELKNICKESINKNFYNEKENRYCNGVQGEDILPLFWEMLENKSENLLNNKLINHYLETRHFDTGIILTPILLEYLAKIERFDIAYNLLMEESFPSFSYMLENETTLVESWSKKWPWEDISKGESDVSHCHPMFGSVVSWIVKHVGGLDISNIYEKTIIFSPKYIDKIKKVCVIKNTVYGISKCKYNNSNKFKMEIIVPYGVQGIVKIPKNIGENIFINHKQKIKLDGNYFTTILKGGKYIIHQKRKRTD